MQVQSYQFIEQLAIALHNKIKNYEVLLCFSQHKDELIMGLASPEDEFYIQADLVPEVSMLYFPTDFQRAKKNSVNLFSETIGKKVQVVYPHVNERSFHFELEDDFQLLFKLHGRNSNIILFHRFQIISLFKNNIENDWNINLKDLVRANGHSNRLIADALNFNNAYVETFKKQFYFNREKESVLKILQDKRKKSEAYIVKTELKVADLKVNQQYEKLANILMANLHLMIEGQPSADFFDFYDNRTITIKLKKDLSLQKNAEILYRKAKNQKIEIEIATKNLEAKKKELLVIQNHISTIENTIDYRLLKEYLKKNNLQQGNKKEESAVSPFKVTEIEGFQVLVGKNAQNNDLLTMKYAYKEDLWLHAKDVSGSHVVVKYIPGRNFPKFVIERAAQLAAFYSKRKNEGLVPVIVTPRKYIRKPKGALPGKVIVEREDIVLVEPKDIQ